MVNIISFRKTGRFKLKKNIFIVIKFDENLLNVTTFHLMLKKILNYFQSSLKGKTAIIISHRIYVNLHFDKILVFQDGEVAHAGTHEELLKISPYYLDLYERQLSDERLD